MRFVEMSNFASGFVPVNLATAANDGDWISLANYHHVAIVLFKGVGTAGEDPTLTIEQATSNAGAGAKALTFTVIHTKQGADLTAIGQFTKVTQAAAGTYTSLTAAEEQLIWVVEFDSDELDVDGAFAWVRGRVADVGASSQIGGLLYILTEPRDAQALTVSAL